MISRKGTLGLELRVRNLAVLEATRHLAHRNPVGGSGVPSETE